MADTTDNKPTARGAHDQREAETRELSLGRAADTGPASVSAMAQTLPVLDKGARVGRFEVIDQLGEGGMGLVLTARDATLDRKVALKLLRPHAWGADSHGMASQRLLREAHAMAKLAHPNVVAVHEVGTFEGQVFVAMEYVDGTNLREWHKARPRSWREVVDVFVEAGRGLAAAHDAGLVHRDFKPENVLVALDGRVRVTDFGLASTSSAVADEVGEPASGVPQPASSTPLSTTLTRTGSILGTPLYMAPEQHGCAKVDAAADQFAFCVALYEALYDARPFAGTSYQSLASNVIAGRLEQPPVDVPVPAWLGKTLAKGLRPDPQDRFPSMKALLGELRTDPVAVRRRRLAAGATIAGLATLGAIAVIAFQGGDDAASRLCAGARARLTGVWDDATQAAVSRAFQATERSYAGDTARRVAHILDEYAAEWVSMHEDACAATNIRKQQPDRILDLRMSCLERRRSGMSALAGLLAARPDVEVLDKSVEAALGLDPIASCADVTALSASRPLPEQPDQRRSAEALLGQLDQAKALSAVGKHGDAEPILAVVVAATAGQPSLHARALQQLGVAQAEMGRLTQAESTLRAALPIAAQAADDEVVVQIWLELMWQVGFRQARYDEALTLRNSAEAAIARAGDRPAMRADLLHILANLAKGQGRYADAGGLMREAIELRKQSPNEPPGIIALGYTDLGNLHVTLQQHVEAQRYFERALEIWEEELGGEHPTIASALGNLGVALAGQSKYEEALVYDQRAHDIFERALGPDHPDVATSLSNIGAVLQNLGSYPQARSAYERALSIRRSALGDEHPDVGIVLNNLGEVAQLEHDFERGLDYFGGAREIFEKALGAEHPFVSYPLTGLGQCYVGMGKPEQARVLLELALTMRESYPEEPAEVARTRYALARALWPAKADRARALELARQALAAYTDIGATKLGQRSQVERWLSSHSL